MRLGKREREALRKREAVQRANQARDLAGPHGPHIRSMWDNMERFRFGKVARSWGHTKGVPRGKVTKIDHA